MNIAYMILAHHQPRQLQRLVERLSYPGAYFFIHMDSKSRNTEEVRRIFGGNDRVKVIADNSVNWMGFTTIDAQLDLIKLAYNSGILFKYYVLLSGADYPIKCNEQIFKFYREHHEDFLSYNSFAYLGKDFTDKTKYYHLRDITWLNPRHPNRVQPLVRLYFALHTRLRRFMPERQFYKGFTPYFGSQWWSISEGTIAYILRYLDEHPGYMRSMRHTDGPDEVFFQTLILNTERRANVTDYARFTAWLKTRKDGELFNPALAPLTYMDWTERAKTKPALLDLSYFDDLAEAPHLYARKVDEHASKELLDRIDAELLT